MFQFYTELLKTKDELKYNEVRAQLETAKMKYRTYQRSAESTQMAAASISHLMQRPKNPSAYNLNNPGLSKDTMHEIVHDGPPEDAEYVIEVPRKDLAAARSLVKE